MTKQEFLLFTEYEIAEYLAKQAQSLRVSKNLTQKEFSKKAGIKEATYGKFERTGEISFIGFLKILRHLGKLKGMSNLLETDNIEELGVKEFLKLKNTQNQRKRASSKK